MNPFFQAACQDMLNELLDQMNMLDEAPSMRDVLAMFCGCRFQ